MLIKVQVLPQKKQIELLDEVTFTTEVICSTENSVQTEWSLNPRGLGNSSTMLKFSSLILVKRNNVFTLKIEWEINNVQIHDTLDVTSAEEVMNFPPIQHRYKR